MRWRWLAGAPLLLLAIVACGGDDGTGPDGDIPAELVATWRAEPACFPRCGLTLYARSNPADTLNLAQFSSVRMTVESSGRLRMDVSAVRDTLLNGNLTVRGNQLLVSSAGGTSVDTLDYTLVVDTLRIQLRTVLSVDMNGDGTQEPVGLRGVFLRR